MTELSLLDERLAEIDERLRALQSDLHLDDAPAAADPPPAAPPPPTPAPARPQPAPLRAVGVPADGAASESVLAQLRELGGAHERLLELHRELLSQYARLLERRAAETASVPLVVGPFADAGALRAFESELRGLSDVAEVTIREFLGGDRVAVDVRLTRG